MYFKIFIPEINLILRLYFLSTFQKEKIKKFFVAIIFYKYSVICITQKQ